MLKQLADVHARMEQEMAQLLMVEPDDPNYCCPQCKAEQYEPVWDERMIRVLRFVCLTCGVTFADPEDVEEE